MENVKIVVVGNGACGKTCFLITYTTNLFPRVYVPTVFETYTANDYICGRLFMFGLWDTAGQEDYDRLRPLSYTDTDCFLVCFSIVDRYSFENVDKKWIPEIRHHCPTAPFLIVGLQSDLRDDAATIECLQKCRESPILKEDGKALAEKVGAYAYVECSALTQNGLKNVFEEAAKSIIDERKTRKKKQCVLQ